MPSHRPAEVSTRVPLDALFGRRNVGSHLANTQASKGSSKPLLFRERLRAVPLLGWDSVDFDVSVSTTWLVKCAVVRELAVVM